MPTQRSRKALPLNTNNISLHEEAIKAFKKNDDNDDDKAIRNIDQYRLKLRAKTQQSVVINSWKIEKRRLDDLEEKGVKQLNVVLQRLDLPPSHLLLQEDDDLSASEDDPVLARVERVLSEYYLEASDSSRPTPAMVARCLLQARDEMNRIGEELEDARKAAAAEARKARLQVTEALRADLNKQEFPPQLQAKVNALKKMSQGIHDSDDDGGGSGEEFPYISLEATIIERFTKVQAKYDERISKGKDNLDESTISFKREMQQATRWAMKQADDAIARESTRREESTLAMIRKELKEECTHRLAQLREAREKAALIVMREEKERQLAEEKKKLEHAAQKEKARTETRAALENWKESQRQEEERQRVEDCARKYQEELGRIDRMKANGERVSYREKKHLHKMDEKRRALEEAAKAEELKYERLSQLAATVPYWDNILDVRANIHGSTVAREKAVYHKDSTGLTAFQHGLSKLHSFTNDKVFSDRAFRLGHALHEKGISHTAAARDAVALCCPRQRNPIFDHS